MALMFTTAQKAWDKIFDTMEKIRGETLPKTYETLDNSNEFFNSLSTTVSNTSASIFNIAKVGIGITGLKYICDVGISWYQGAKLIGVASDARNDFKKLVDNTTKTENEVINILTKASDDFKSSANQCTKNIHKIGQDFTHMAESVSQSSNLSSESIAYMSQDFHQASRYAVQASRCFMVACVSLSTSALAASMIYLQNSSCDDDRESMLCVAPLKSMAAATIATGFVALGMLMSKRVQPQINESTEINFFIPEEGIDQNVAWTEEQLDSIKAKNFSVFNVIKAKKKLEDHKWTKPELEWLLSEDKDTFLDVLTRGIFTPSGSSFE